MIEGSKGAQVAFVAVLACSLWGTAIAGDDYEPPRAASGQPDFKGIWQAMNEANWNLEPSTAAAGPVVALGAAYAEPPSLGYVLGGNIPYQARALEQRHENYAKRLELDPEI